MKGRSLASSALLGLLLAACAHLPSSGSEEGRCQVPDRSYLMDRVEQLYRAESSGDWKAFYAMTSPEFRQQSSFEEFQGGMARERDFEIVSWSVRRIRGAERDDEAPKEVDGCAEVLMDVYVEDRGARREKQDDQTDYWIHVDGEWYWTWRGWPND